MGSQLGTDPWGGWQDPIEGNGGNNWGGPPTNVDWSGGWNAIAPRFPQLGCLSIAAKPATVATSNLFSPISEACEPCAQQPVSMTEKCNNKSCGDIACREQVPVLVGVCRENVLHVDMADLITKSMKKKKKQFA